MKKHSSVMSLFKYAVVTIGLMLSVVLIGETKADVVNPDTIIFEVHSKTKSIDPVMVYDPTGVGMAYQMYENLFKFEHKTNEYIPWLAESYELSDDGLTYTFKIRKGVKFHDGTDLDALAIKKSFDRTVLMAQPRGFNNYLRGIIKGTTAFARSDKTVADVQAYYDAKGVEVIDDYTLVIRLEKPYPPFKLVLSLPYWGIISPKFVEAHGGVEVGKVNEYIASHAVGTGPYKLKNLDIGSGTATFEAFDDYWGTPAKTGPAKVGRVIFRPIADPLTRVLNLKSGQSDMAQLSPNQLFEFIDRDEWEENKNLVSKVKGIEVLGPFKESRIEAIGLNRKIRDRSGNPVDFQPFADKRVREAFTYAFDYETYRNDVLKGFAFPINGPVPEGWFGYDASIPTYKTNLARAKQLLEEAGPDVGFSKNNPKTITLSHPAGEKATEAAMLMLASTINSMQVGLQVMVMPAAYPAWVSDLYGKRLDVVRVSWPGGLPDPDPNLKAFGDGEDGILAKVTSYIDPELIKIIDAQRHELNEDRRRALISKASWMINKDFAYVWRAQITNFWVQRDWIDGYAYNRMTIAPYMYDLSKGE